MKRKDGGLFYSFRETAYIIGCSTQTIMNWNRINKKVLNQGKNGIIPIPTQINKFYYFSENDIGNIKKNMDNFKKGDFKEFNRKSTYQKIKEENAQLINQINEIKGDEK